jgi:hypothetical protein
LEVGGGIGSWGVAIFEAFTEDGNDRAGVGIGPVPKSLVRSVALYGVYSGMGVADLFEVDSGSGEGFMVSSKLAGNVDNAGEYVPVSSNVGCRLDS